MFVTFTRCEWRGGSRRLIKAAGMLIGRGHCCPLCSARSYWASVAPVKGQRTDLKSVTLTPHTLRRPPHTHMYTDYPTYNPLVRPRPFFLLSWRKWSPLLLSFPPCCLIRWLAPPSPLGLIQCWGSNFITAFSSFLFFLLWSNGQLRFQSAREVFKKAKRGLLPIFSIIWKYWINKHNFNTTGASFYCFVIHCQTSEHLSVLFYSLILKCMICSNFVQPHLLYSYVFGSLSLYYTMHKVISAAGMLISF